MEIYVSCDGTLSAQVVELGGVGPLFLLTEIGGTAQLLIDCSMPWFHILEKLVGGGPHACEHSFRTSLWRVN